MAIVTKTYFLKGRTILAVTIMALSVTLVSCSELDSDSLRQYPFHNKRNRHNRHL